MAPRKSFEKDEIKVIDDHELTHLEAAAGIVEIDTFRVLGLNAEDAEFYTKYPEEKRKKVFRKVKIHITSNDKLAAANLLARLMLDSSPCCHFST